MQRVAFAKKYSIYKKNILKIGRSMPLTIKTSKIKLFQHRAHMSIIHVGMCEVLSGDWDLQTSSIEKLDYYIAFKEFFVKNKLWQDTSLYRKILCQIKSGENKFGYKTKMDLDLKTREWEKLFNSIKANGYLSQFELKSERFWDDIRVCIGRDGSVRFVDGRHRLAICKILGIEYIPVFVTVIHLHYYNFCKTNGYNLFSFAELDKYDQLGGNVTENQELVN